MSNDNNINEMPAFVEGRITLWRNGTWVQVDIKDIDAIMEKDRNGTQNSPDVPSRF